MKRLFITLFYILSGSLSAQSLNEIIDYHFDAVQQDKFNKIQTIIIEADVSGGAGSGKLVISHKRPDKLKVEEIIGGERSYIVFDGEEGVSVTAAVTEKLSGDALEDVRFNADLDGYFFCYREKTHSLNYLGTVTEGKKQYHKIMCVKPWGDTTDIYLNTKTYLIDKTSERRKGAVKESILENYKPVNGIKFPHKITISQNGVKTVQTVKKIILDKEIPDSLFTSDTDE